MPVGTEHETALGILSILRKMSEANPSNTFEMLHGYLQEREMLRDVQPIIVFDDGVQKIDLESRTDRGLRVLMELAESSQLACPEGMCEFSGNACIWCGTIRN